MKSLSFFFLIFFSLSSSAQKIRLQTIARLPKILGGSSGLALTDSDELWTMNDHGENKLFEINLHENLHSITTKQIDVLNVAHHDWEDLAEDDSGHVYIGDFGNNLNRRQEFSIYKISAPRSIFSNEIDTLPPVTADTISFHYLDQKKFPPPPSNWNFDCEAFFHLGDSLYLFSKNVSNPNDGYTKRYRLCDRAGVYVAELIDSFQLNEPVTAADVSADGKTIVLLTYFSLWVLKDFPNNNFFGGKLFQFRFKGLTQKEGICFANEHELFISDERHFGKGGKLYKIDLNHLDFSHLANKNKAAFSKRAIYNFFNNPKRKYKKYAPALQF